MPSRSTNRARRAAFGLALGAFAVVSAALIGLLSLALFEAIHASRTLTATHDDSNPSFVLQGDRYVTASPRMVNAGFRAAKSLDAFRVFILGGSQAMGSPYVHQRFSDRLTSLLGLSNRGGIASWLEIYLREILPDRRIEVVNAARGGGSLGDALPTFREILDFGEADLVLFLSGNNERIEEPADTFEDHLENVSRNHARRVRTVVELAENHVARVYFLTVPTNIREWLPHSPAAAHHPGLHSRVRPEEWAPVAERMLADRAADTEDALVLFALGKQAEADGRWEEAKRLYTRAKDIDHEFVRARSRWNDVVRGIRSPNVRVLDLEATLSGYSEHGMPGFDLFHDHVHFKLHTNSIVAYEIARFLAHDFELKRRPTFLDSAESIGITPGELRKLYVAKKLKWLKVKYYGGLSQIVGANSRAVSAQYQQERESLSAIEHKLGAAVDLKNETSPRPGHQP